MSNQTELCWEESCKALPTYLKYISRIIKVEIYKKYCCASNCGVNGCGVNSDGINDSIDMIHPINDPPSEAIEAANKLDNAIENFIKNHSFVNNEMMEKLLQLPNFHEQPHVEQKREIMLELEKNGNILIHETQCHEGKLALMKKLLDDDCYELISTLSGLISFTSTIQILDLIMVLKADDTNRFIQIEINQKTDPITFKYYNCMFSLA